jgi:hypothetical protein
MTSAGTPTCPYCGLPGAECNAWVRAREAAEDWLRADGYSGLEAKEAVAALVPDHRKQIAAARAL